MGTGPAERDPARGVYPISVVSELTGLGPQTLRLYETKGLLSPGRTEGGVRRYSDDDLSRLRRITTLTKAGLNLAGIRHVLELEQEVRQLREQLAAAGLTDAGLAQGGLAQGGLAEAALAEAGLAEGGMPQGRKGRSRAGQRRSDRLRGRGPRDQAGSAGP